MEPRGSCGHCRPAGGLAALHLPHIMGPPEEPAPGMQMVLWDEDTSMGGIPTSLAPDFTALCTRLPLLHLRSMSNYARKLAAGMFQCVIEISQ